MTPDERPVADEATVTVLWRGVVNAPDGLNLRPTPATAQPPLALLSHQTPLQVLEDLDDWLRVIVGEEASGPRGYVYAAHVLRRLDPRPFDRNPDERRKSDDALAAPPDQQITLAPSASYTERLLAGIWNRFGGVLQMQAQRLGLDPTLAAALFAIESHGDGYGSDGRLLIRFENHLFYQYWGEQHQAQYFAHFTFDPNTVWLGHRWRPDPNAPWQECHLDDQAVEWQVFSFARQLDETAALFSISMGIAQIMGFNYAAVGFADVQSMFQACSASIANQIAASFRFLETNHLVEAARSGDYYTVGRVYNGPGQTDAYVAKLHSYVATLAALQQPIAPALPEPIPLPVPPSLPTPAPERTWLRRLRIAAAALSLLALAALALYEAGRSAGRKAERARAARKEERATRRLLRRRAKPQTRSPGTKRRVAAQLARLLALALERD